MLDNERSERCVAVCTFKWSCVRCCSNNDGLRVRADYAGDGRTEWWQRNASF